MEVNKRDKKLFAEISHLINESKKQFALAANAGITFLYWKIGNRINSETLQNTRAGYGKKIVLSLALRLSEHYGKGFEEKSLRRMMQFAQVFSDDQIVVSLTRQLSWTHFIFSMLYD
jgi:hypothetical protein